MRQNLPLALICVITFSSSCLTTRYRESTCIKRLQQDIRSNWVVLEDIGPLFPVTYQRNDAFCNRVRDEYSKCLVGKKSKEDIKALFGERGVNLQYSIKYHCKYKESDELMCFQFAFNELDTLRDIRYRKCKYGDL